MSRVVVPMATKNADESELVPLIVKRKIKLLWTAIRHLFWTHVSVGHQTSDLVGQEELKVKSKASS